MILCVAVACVIVAGAIVYVNLTRSALPVPEGLPPTEMVNGAITVPADMSACSAGESCIVVDKSCGLCCDFTAINSIHERIFDGMFRQGCKPYRGKSCNCVDLSSYPSCVDGTCMMVKWPDGKGLGAVTPAATPPAPEPETVYEAQEPAPPAPRPETPAPGPAPATARPLPAPVPTPAPEFVPAPAPAPQAQPDAFGSGEQAPAPQTPAPENQDLFAPLPSGPGATPAPSQDDLNRPF